MAGERIDIEVADKISNGVIKKLNAMAIAADKAAISKERLNQATYKTIQAESRAEAAFSLAIAAEKKSAIASQKATQEKLKTKIVQQQLTAETQKAIIANNKATESQHRLSTATANATTAEIKAEAAFSSALMTENRLTAQTEKLASSRLKQAKADKAAELSTRLLDVNTKGLTTSFKAHSDSSVQLVAAHNKLYKEQISLRKSQHELNVKRKEGVLKGVQLAAAENKLAIASNKVTAAGKKVRDVIAREQKAKELLVSTTNRLTVAQTRASTASNGLKSAAGAMFRTFAAYVGIREVARVVIGSADAFVELQNKLKLVTDTQRELNNVTEQVFDIANRTRSSVQTTTQAFIRFDMAMSQLGASQKESLRLTETINKQLILSGAATSEQRSALLQLSQAFNKGKLDGDEFRSVMELMPPVADAIAKELGVMRGELLNLAPEGVITAQVMRDALAGVADDVDKAFGETIPTIGQSFEVLKNKTVAFFGEAGRGNKIVATLSGTILGLANNIDSLGGVTDEASESFDSIFDQLGPVKRELGEVLDIVKPLYSWIAKLWIKLSTSPLRLIAWQFKKVSEVVNNVIKIFHSLWTVLKSVGTMVKTVWQRFKTWFSGMESRFSFLRKISNFFSELAGQIDLVLRGLKAAATAAANTIPNLTGQASQSAGASSGRLANYASGQKTEVFGKSGTDSHIRNAAARVAQSIANKTKDALDSLPTVSAVFKPGEKKKGGGGGRRSTKAEDTSLGFEGTTLFGHMKNVDSIIDDIDEMNMSATKLNETKKKSIEISIREQTLQGNLNKIYEETIGAEMKLYERIDATNRAMQMGMITTTDYGNRIKDLSVELSNLQLQMGTGDFNDVINSALGQMVSDYENAATSIANAFGNMFTTLNDGFADSIGRAIVYGDDLGDSLRNVAKGAMSELISSFVKMGVQHVATMAMQTAATKTALATTTAANVAAGSTTAAAWAPAAATASLGSFGSNAIPAAIGIASIIAAVAGIAALSRGFESGGYTGDVGRSDVAGVVHGREFVMDAGATARLGVSNLEALQRGSANIQGSDNVATQGAFGGGGDTVIVNVMDSSMIEDYLSSPESDNVILNKIERNNDTVRQMVT